MPVLNPNQFGGALSHGERVGNVLNMMNENQERMGGHQQQQQQQSSPGGLISRFLPGEGTTGGAAAAGEGEGLAAAAAVL